MSSETVVLIPDLGALHRFTWIIHYKNDVKTVKPQWTTYGIHTSQEMYATEKIIHTTWRGGLSVALPSGAWDFVSIEAQDENNDLVWQYQFGQLGNGEFTDDHDESASIVEDLPIISSNEDPVESSGEESVTPIMDDMEDAWMDTDDEVWDDSWQDESSDWSDDWG